MRSAMARTLAEPVRGHRSPRISRRARPGGRRPSSHSVSAGGSAGVASSRISTFGSRESALAISTSLPFSQRRAGAPPCSGLKPGITIAGEEIERLQQARRRGRCRAATAARHEPEPDILLDGQVGDERQLLQYGRDARRLRAACGSRGAKGTPVEHVLPASGRTAPARIWMKVLLPAPFSPSSTCTSPARA